MRQKPISAYRISNAYQRRWIASLLLSLVACVCLFCHIQPAIAAITWSGDVDPDDPTTWNSSTDSFIGKTGQGTMEITGGDMVVNDVGTIGRRAGSIGEVTVAGAGSTWTSNDLLFIGRAGSGTLAISDGGAVVGDRWVTLGHDSGATGIVTVDGTGSQLSSSLLYVGYDGNGTLQITDGGTISNAASGNIGVSAGSIGVVTVNGVGSTWNSDSLQVGQSGSGTLSITGGGTVNSGDSTIGFNSSSTGTVTVDGAGSTWINSGDLKIGRSGNGMLNITGGGEVTVAEDTWVTFFGGSTNGIQFDNGTLTTESLFANFDDLTGTGLLNVHGMVSDVDLMFDSTRGLIQTFVVNDSPTQNVTVNLEVSSSSRNLGAGYSGVGTMSISGGVTVPTIDGTIGYKAGSTGQVTVDGVGSTWTQTQKLRVGYEGGGTLNVTGGGAVTSRWSRIGDEVESTGEVTVDGVGSTWTSNWLDVGREGDGTLYITGGGIVDSQLFAFIGYAANATGEVNVSGTGSTWIVNRLEVGFNNDGGSSTLEITDGGLLRVDSVLNIDLRDQNGSDFINLATGGMLAIIGDADDSLAQFFGLIGGSDAIRYWDESQSDWADLAGATLGDDYTLSFQASGDLIGYTLLTVGTPFPNGAYNLDGDVDGADFLKWQSTFGSTANLDADGNKNGVIDATDFTVWRDSFGTTSQSAFTSIPEPSTYMLVTLLGILMGISHGRSYVVS